MRPAQDTLDHEAAKAEDIFEKLTLIVRGCGLGRNANWNSCRQFKFGVAPIDVNNSEPPDTEESREAYEKPPWRNISHADKINLQTNRMRLEDTLHYSRSRQECTYDSFRRGMGSLIDYGTTGLILSSV